MATENHNHFLKKQADMSVAYGGTNTNINRSKYVSK